MKYFIVLMMMISMSAFAWETNIEELKATAKLYFTDATPVVIDDVSLKSRGAAASTIFNRDMVPIRIVLKSSYKTWQEGFESYFHELTHVVQWFHGEREFKSSLAVVPKTLAGFTPYNTRFLVEVEAELVGWYLIGLLEGKQDDGARLYILNFLQPQIKVGW